VTAVLRTSPRLLAIVALAAVVSGCATFSDNDLAARVGSAELSQTDLGRRLGGDGEPVERADGEAARSAIADFVRRAVADQVGLFDRYSSGDATLGVACFDALQVVDGDQGNELAARLAAGETWTDVAESVAPGAAAGSRVPCQPIAQVAPDVPEIAETLAELRPDGPPIVLDLPELGAAIVFRPHPVDEVNITDFLNAASTANPTLIEQVQAEAASGDIYVDPRFGKFDATTFSVVPLG
jgi:hypothetical protein